MLKRRFSPLLALLFVVLFAQPACAFFDTPYITPSAPIAGEAVSVVITDGGCDAIIGTQGFPQITRDGNAIRILFFGVHATDSEQCIYPPGTAPFLVGGFPAGSYTLKVDFLYDNYPFGPATMTLGTVPFSVTAAPAIAVPVPASNSLMLLTLVLTLSGLAVLRVRARRSSMLLLIVFVVAQPHANAQTGPVPNLTIQILVTNAPGAPTAAQIVSYYSVPAALRAGPPPLNAFAVKAPQAVNYLMSARASGDFLGWLNNNTHSARYQLEQIILATFQTVGDVATALSALRADPYVASAYEPVPTQPSSASLTQFSVGEEIVPLGAGNQYGRDDFNISAAWKLAGGYAQIAVLDTGLYVDHAALRQFSGSPSQYVGGNFMPAVSLDIGLTGVTPNADDTNVDEAEPVLISDTACNPAPNPPRLMAPANAGHGTHVTGLISANGSLGVQGTCKHCGIAMWKTEYAACKSTLGTVLIFPNNNATDRGVMQATDTSAQVINMSSGGSLPGQNSSFCRFNHALASCLGFAYAGDSRDVAIIASSGNDRQDVNFPAFDPRIISAGGFDSNLALWIESPEYTNTTCPLAPSGIECGSNRSVQDHNQYLTHQELVGSAKSVLSTTYPNKDWIAYAECGDSYPGPMGNGVGLCTGTSMSAPQIAGVVGLLRSINPLVPTSVPEPTGNVTPGLRTVLAQTASRAHAGQGWDPKFGYGIPNAADAASRMLGKVEGRVVRNRVTPLFRLYDASTKDFADTTSPQFALSLMINQVHNYTQPIPPAHPTDPPVFGSESPVPGYAFPYDKNDPSDANDAYDDTPPAAPRAAIYVLTTEYRPRNEWPALIPLYLMEKDYPSGKDYMLVTTTAEIEHAYNGGNNGYNLRTIQGYIYQACSPNDCMPPGAVKVWRQFNVTNNDCAVFLDSEKPAFVLKSYTAACPAGPNMLLGYAYPADDSDGDGLPDGFEYVVGTDPHSKWSNGAVSATESDGTRFPMAGLEVSDPCVGGPLGAKNCGADVIFKYGFE